MTHKQGLYWSPRHDQFRGRILQHIVRIKPAFSVIMTENWQPISEAWAAHEHMIAGRVWEIDDGPGHSQLHALAANPEAAADVLMGRYLAKRDEWYRESGNYPMPDDMHLFGHAWNEPNAIADDATIIEGTKYLLRLAILEQFPMVALNISVGCPETWSAYDDSELEQLIIDSGSVVGLHGYWQREGPHHVWTDETGKLREDYPYLAGRHHGFPLDVPIVMSEVGIDGGIYGRNPQWGWKNYALSPQKYTAQLLENHQALDERVIAQCPFTADYQNGEWWGFDTVDAMSCIEDWVDCLVATEPPVQVHIPNVTVDEPQPQPEPVQQTGIIDSDVALAIMDVEAGGGGFGDDGQLKIRFEAHIFRSQLNDDALFDRYFDIAETKPWAQQQWVRLATGDLSPIHSGSQSTEYAALRVARELDAEAAYKSVSMGIAQVMGFNAARVGYSSAQAMYVDFSQSEAAQIVAFFNYVLSDDILAQAIKAQDWRTIARHYNGAGAVNIYAPRLEAAYRERLENAVG